MPTKIEWTDESWNPVVGCTKVSEGCQNCYAEKMAARLWRMGRGDYGSVLGIEDYKWNGKIFCRKGFLDKPLHWKKPRMIFVCSMGDLFHESVPESFIDEVVQVILACHRHTFQILTKRPKVVLEYIKYMRRRLGILYRRGSDWTWPSNVWLGVTCENQKCADERIPILLQIPAAHRFVSLEPLLGGVDFGRVVGNPQLSEFTCSCEAGVAFVGDYYPERGYKVGKYFDPNDPGWETCCSECGCEKYRWNIDWVIIGAETGPRRRPCKIEWVRDIVQQCKTAGVPVFVKQLSINGKVSHNPEEWPEDLRVRELPYGKKENEPMLLKEEWEGSPSDMIRRYTNQWGLPPGF